MKTKLLLLLLATTAQAQVIQITPTNYSQTILSQNNVGSWFSSWQDNAQNAVTLSNRVLVMARTTFFDVPFAGTKFGGPRQLVDRYCYRQIGGASYVPVGSRLEVADATSDGQAFYRVTTK